MIITSPQYMRITVDQTPRAVRGKHYYYYNETEERLSVTCGEHVYVVEPKELVSVIYDGATWTHLTGSVLGRISTAVYDELAKTVPANTAAAVDAELLKVVPQKTSDSVDAELLKVVPQKTSDSVNAELIRVVPKKTSDSVDAELVKVVSTKTDTELSKILPSRVDTRTDLRLDETLASNVDARVKNKLDAELNTNIDARTKNRLDAELDTNVDDRTDARLNTTLIPNVDARTNARLDSALVDNVNSRLNVTLNANVDARTKTRLDNTLNTDVDARTKTRLDDVLNTDVDARTKTRLDEALEPNVDSRVKSKLDAELDTNIDVRTKNRLDSTLNPDVDTRTGSRLDAVLDTNVDARTKARLDSTLNTNVDTRTDARLDTELDTNVDARTKERLDNTLNPDVDARTKTRLDATLNTNVDTRTNARLDAELDTNVDTRTATWLTANMPAKTEASVDAELRKVVPPKTAEYADAELAKVLPAKVDVAIDEAVDLSLGNAMNRQVVANDGDTINLTTQKTMISVDCTTSAKTINLGTTLYNGQSVGVYVEGGFTCSIIGTGLEDAVATAADIFRAEVVAGQITEIKEGLDGDRVAISTLAALTSSVVPTGYVKCDGTEYSRTDYPTLNGIYRDDGYPHGAGDGSTTFNVPNWSENGVITRAVKIRHVRLTETRVEGQTDQRIHTIEENLHVVSSSTAKNTTDIETNKTNTETNKTNTETNKTDINRTRAEVCNVVTAETHHLLDASKGDIIYRSEISNILNAENFEETTNTYSVDGISCYEGYENLSSVIYPLVKYRDAVCEINQFEGGADFEITSQATKFPLSVKLTEIKYPMDTYLVFEEEVTLGSFSFYSSNKIELIEKIHISGNKYYVKQDAEDNVFLGHTSVIGTLRNMMIIEDVSKVHLPYVADKHIADKNIISTASWGPEGQIGFTVDIKGDLIKTHHLLTFGGNLLYLALYQENEIVGLRVNGEYLLNPPIRPLGVFRINLIWTETYVELFINGLSVEKIMTKLVWNNEVLVGNEANCNFTEFFYTPSATLITKPVADKDITYFTNGSYQDKLGQLRLSGDKRPYITSNDLHQLTSPENGDIVYHCGDQIIHSNLMADSAYAVEGSKGIWCGEEYSNYALDSCYPKFVSNTITESTKYSYLTPITLPIDTVVYVSLKARFIEYVSSELHTHEGFIHVQLADGKQGGEKVEASFPNDGAWHDVSVALNAVSYLSAVVVVASKITDSPIGNSIELKDVVLTTIPNAPYVKDQQPPSNVSIDTSSWNAKSGCFSFRLKDTLGTVDVADYYVFDSRREGNTSPKFVLLKDSNTRTELGLGGRFFGFDYTLKAAVDYHVVWKGIRTYFYENSTLITTLSASPQFDQGSIMLGKSHVGNYANTNISNVVYRNSTELPTKPFIDPRFNVLSNGGFTDHMGNNKDDVYYQRRKGSLGTAVETGEPGVSVTSNKARKSLIFSYVGA